MAELALTQSRTIDLVLDALDRAGIDLPVVADVRRLDAHATDITRRRAALTHGRSATAKDIAQRLATGDITIPEAEAESDALVRAASDHPAHNVLASAATIARGGAIRLLRQHGPDIVARLKAEAGDIVDAIRNLRGALVDIPDATAAAKAGVETAGAWAEYVALLDRWETVHGVHNTLAGGGVIDPHPVDARYHTTGRYGRPDLADVDARRVRRQGGHIRPILDETCDAWEPGLYDAAEAHTNLKRAYQAAEAGATR